jgi:uncharacterized protein (DUF433 family)
MSVVETPVATDYRYIIMDSKKRPIIAGTNMRVTQLVIEKQAYGWSPEELRYQHPHLTLGQVYSALAYYADHHEELDQAIDEELKSIDQYRSTLKQANLGDKHRTVHRE